jgi:hypothetical protein
MRYQLGIWLLGLGAIGILGPAEAEALQQETVSFDGQTLLLASRSENPGETVKEYIPAGEELRSWTRLASIREYPALNDPKAVVANLIKALKQQNPESRHAVIENPKTGEVVIDFVTWPADQSFVEFNVFKYSRREGGGLVAEQYALRDYKDPRGFMRGLKPVRARLVKLMTEGGLRSAH